MKKLIAACIAIAAATPSIATTTNLGTISGPSITAQFTPVGPTSDIFNFSLSQAGSLYGSVTNISLSPAGFGSIYNSTGWLAELYEGTSVNPSSFIGSVASDSSATFSNLLATDYTLQISGVGTGSLGGAYTLTLVPQAAAPVPGPAGLVVAGAAGAVIAFRARKRRQATDKLATA